MEPSFRNSAAYKQFLQLALDEDIGQGDITSQCLIPESRQATLHFRNRGPLVVAGLFMIQDVLERFTSPVKVELQVAEGQLLQSSQIMATLNGNARILLTAERLMLNLIQRSCGVAALTHRYVQAVEGTGAIILDTRKTMPGMRMIDKYAVTCGGGYNHRMRLDDRILIKDNHIALAGGVSAAISQAKAGNVNGLILEVECDTLEQVSQACEAGVDWILLDNMTLPQLRESVLLGKGRAKLEASGGVNLQTVRGIAETGVDAISVGALTHSAPAADIGLDITIA